MMRIMQPTAPDLGEVTFANSTLYRQIFVGRQAELQQLRTAFDQAVLGQGALIALAGEAGIGKTAICEQFAAYVGEHGGHALIGHCYEDTSSPPYLAFVEALRSWVRGVDAQTLRSALASGAPDVARILPEVHERIQVEIASRSESEDERWRLLEAVVAFLKNIAAIQPTLLVLEDLHDADRGTLDMLQHLGRSIAGSRLVVAATYRDVEVARSHPLSGVLAELRRTGRMLRLHLGGLTPHEVHRMACLMRGAEVPWAGAEDIHRQTEGNPLFVQEVIRYLIDKATTPLEDAGQVAGDHGSPAEPIPEGLREVIGKRLSRLSERASVLLTVASVVGQEVRLDVLQRVADLTQPELEDALAEARAAAVLEEQPGFGGAVTYRFTHALFRRALYEDMLAPRRMRLHQQVARALEEVYVGRLDEHAAELAAHFAYCSDPDDLTRAVTYGERAAARALSVYAYSEAVRELERALEVHELLSTDERLKRCDVLLALGEAVVAAGEPRRALETVAPAAFELAREAGDRHRGFRACHVAMQAMRLHRGGAVFFTSDWQTWTRRADAYAEPGTLERLEADLELAHGRHAADAPDEGWMLAKRGLALTHELQDRAALIHAYEVLLAWPGLPQHELERHQLSLDFPEALVGEVDSWLSAMVVWLIGANMLRWGARPRAEELWDALSRPAARMRSSGVRLFPAVSSAILATVDGKLDNAISAASQMAGQGDEFGHVELARRWGVNSMRAALLYLGRGEEALAAVGPATVARPAPDNATGRPDSFLAPEAALCFAHLGRREEAQRGLQAHLAPEPAESFQETLSTNSLTWLLEAAVLVGDKAAARQFARRLSGAPAQISISLGTAACGTCPARHLGRAAALLGDRQRALDYYRQALEVAGRIAFRPELALTHLQLADVLLAGDDHQSCAAGRAHLEFAIAELTRMQMKPALEVALELAGRTGAKAQAAAAPMTQAFTTLTGRERDVAALLATGRTNREIAAALVITESTVEVHVKHILGKLGFKSRSQVAVWAASNGLLPPPAGASNSSGVQH
jgi:DNA-binding CsgD family transcriptional regulator